MKYKYLLFDADDTLLDFRLAEKEAFYKLLVSKGITPSPSLHKLYSTINRNVWERFEKGQILKEDIGYTRYFEFINASKIDGEAADFNRTYHELLALQGNIIDKADGVCAELNRRGYDIYIVTNGYADTQNNRFLQSGLNPYIKKMFVSETLGVQKPKKEFFDKVLEDIGCYDKEKYLIIGDSLSSDILGGIGSGIDTCWFNSRKCDDDYSIIPTYKIDDIQQLPELLD